MLSHSGSWHFSKLSSAFRHYECCLHVVSIWPFTAWFWIRWEFEWENENQKRLSYSKRRFFGVSQSDFIIQQIFIWTKTQKNDLKLNWQPIIIILVSPAKWLLWSGVTNFRSASIWAKQPNDFYDPELRIFESRPAVTWGYKTHKASRNPELRIFESRPAVTWGYKTHKASRKYRFYFLVYKRY